ncbi:hypothetical protein TNCV_1437051 [Trichonephila clavipes]|nr:hypothetical protein TNCV_1437051 [Trichonephila clavipes]
MYSACATWRLFEYSASRTYLHVVVVGKFGEWDASAGVVLITRQGRGSLVVKLRVLVAALWDKKLAFRTRERRKILDFYGRTATQGEKEIFGSRAAKSEGKRFSEAVLQVNSASEKRASCSKIKLIYSVNGESVRRKAIFGSRAASKFSFGERERPAHRRSN